MCAKLSAESYTGPKVFFSDSLEMLGMFANVVILFRVLVNGVCASDAKSPILEYFMSLRTLRINEPENGMVFIVNK